MSSGWSVYIINSIEKKYVPFKIWKLNFYALSKEAQQSITLQTVIQETPTKPFFTGSGKKQALTANNE